MSDTMQNVRRTASQSMSLLKAATGMPNGRMDTPAAANESTAHTSARTEVMLVSASTEITGSIVTSDEVQIAGKIEGDVRAASITVRTNAKVKGDLNAEVIIVQGAVEGRLQAQDVRLAAGANVSGEIVHGSLGIDTAADFEGTIKRIGKVAS
jgi:cytoskeletal protein CcmA (bactofilin family)